MATYDVNALLSATAYGSDGDKIGKVEQVFLDDNTEEVTFVTVNTGLFGTKESFVPADGAQQDGDRLVLPYTKDVVKDAPNVNPDEGHLSPEEEQRLFQHYGVGDVGRADDAGLDATGTGYDRGDVRDGADGTGGRDGERPRCGCAGGDVARRARASSLRPVPGRQGAPLRQSGAPRAQGRARHRPR